jgi:hypothetical protein
MTKYTLLAAGAVIVSKLAGLPVQLIMLYCADPVEVAPACDKVKPVVLVSVTAV